MDKAQPPFQRHTNRMLTGIRGIAAFWVFIGHLYISPVYDIGFIKAEGLGTLLHSLLFFHFLAVDLFLMISGMLLYHGYRAYFEAPTRSKDIDRFFLHRLARLYPLYLLSVGIIGMYHFAGIPHPIFSGREIFNFEHWKLTLLLNVLLMNAWGIVPQASWNEPSWTLSIFLLLYLIFPNLVVLLKYAPKKAWSLLLLVYGLIILYYGLRWAVPIWTGESLSHSDGTGAIMRGILFFTIGCLISRLYLYADIAHWKWHMIFPSILMLNIIFMVVWHTLWAFDMTLFHLSYPMLMLGLLYAHDRISLSIIANPVAVWLGGISYSLYLMHYPLCLLIEYLAGEQLKTLSSGHALMDSWLVFITIFIICVICWLVTRFIEKPLIRFLK